MFEPCHHHAAVGPMAGVVAPSMWMLVVEDAEHGGTSYCSLNEGLGKVLRYGAYGPEVIERLAWMGEVLGPALREAVRRHAGRARPLPYGEPLLRVEDLTIGFPDRYGDIGVVDRVSLEVRPGEVVGLVGESGCGKSLTSLAIMGLEPRGARIGGRLLFDGRDLRAMPARERRGLLGHEMAMIYQDALSSLNPAMTVRAQLRQLTRRGGTRTPAELLDLVGLDPERTLRSYPHELSGGQRQRVLIAMALSRDPRLVVADEPTTALDVTVQAAVMRLLLRLRAELGFALILVSHDLALVADVADRVVVMYGGQVAAQSCRETHSV
ncbi:hypothetical protein GCM10023178_75190 [Actinomadura luteofluorescens]